MEQQEEQIIEKGVYFRNGQIFVIPQDFNREDTVVKPQLSRNIEFYCVAATGFKTSANFDALKKDLDQAVRVTDPVILASVEGSIKRGITSAENVLRREQETLAVFLDVSKGDLY